MNEFDAWIDAQKTALRMKLDELERWRLCPRFTVSGDKDPRWDDFRSCSDFRVLIVKPGGRIGDDFLRPEDSNSAIFIDGHLFIIGNHCGR